MSREDRHSRASSRRRSGASYDGASRAHVEGMGLSDERYVLRSRVILAAFGIVILAILIRLINLQVLNGTDLSSQAENQRTNRAELHARRGTIYDRNGNVLAMSVDCYTVYCNPKEVSDPSGVASVLQGYLSGTREAYMKTLMQDTTFAYIEHQVDKDVAEAIRADLAELGLGGIYLLDDTKRVYPYGDVGGQVIGLVNIDGDGQSGLELYYDDILKGTDGSLVMEVGLNGDPIAGGISETIPAQNGTDITISIDIDLQGVAEDVIAQAQLDYEADSGSVMMVDPRTGEILACCSTPLATITDRSTLDVNGLSLKLVTDSFEPGSVFKVITLGIGLEEDLFNANTSYSVPSSVLVGDDFVYDFDGRASTEIMTVREILSRSSNTGTALIAQDVIGANLFAEGVERFGIGQLTGIDYPGETTGIVKARDEYDGSTTGSMSFGQGVAIPMVQIVRAYAAVANGGIACTPHFLVSAAGQAQDWGEGTRIVSEETAGELIDIMRTVVEEGTGTDAQVEGYDVVGKTGTGEQASVDEEGYLEYHYVSSFCGFLNGDDPEVLLYVGLNGTPYSSHASAGLFSTIMADATARLNVVPVS